MIIAEDIVISNILYIITVYGGIREYLLFLLPVIQDMAPRWVTRPGSHNSISVLLMKCDWLSVRQMIYYHMVMELYKIKID